MAIPIEYGPNTLLIPLESLSDEEFSAIRLRGLNTTWPLAYYDNGNFPVREVSFWPITATVQGVELWMWAPLATYDSLDEELDLPPGYERYLRFKLAVELAAEFGKEIPPEVAQIAAEAEAMVKKLNQQLPRTMFSPASNDLARSKPQWTYLTMIMGDALPKELR